MNQTRMYWPDEEDQALCLRFMLQAGQHGSGMCSLFGSSRHAGLSRDEAAHRAVEAMTPPEDQP
jgi:hypothetical protein